MIVKTRMSKWTEDLSSLSNILLYDHCCGESLASPTAFPAKFPAYHQMGRVKRLWYLSPMRAVKVQASLRIRAVTPEPLLLAHKSSESSGTFRQKARSLAPLNAWACAVKICHNRMLQDTNLLDGAQMIQLMRLWYCTYHIGDQRRLRRAHLPSLTRAFDVRTHEVW